jgi:hypothetical protein
MIEAKTPNNCAFLVRAPDTEVYGSSINDSTKVPMGFEPSWWCTWGETITKDMPSWIDNHIKSGGNFEPRKHCVNCKVFKSLD